MTDPPVDIWIIDEMQSVCRREDDCDRFGPLILHLARVSAKNSFNQLQKFDHFERLG
jgi:hypothetical protein